MKVVLFNLGAFLITMTWLGALGVGNALAYDRAHAGTLLLASLGVLCLGLICVAFAATAQER